MSLKCIDEGLKTKLLSVYPNVVFGPLSRALENSADQNGYVLSDGELKDTNPDDYEIKHNEITNPLATVGVPDTYQGKTEDRKEKNVVKFPLIAFDRINNPFGTEWRANDPSVRKGRFVIDMEQRERALSITPLYQIDILSDRREEVDDIWRELVFYLYINPNVSVKYQIGNKEFTEEFPIKLLDTDNTTDVESFFDKGNIYRQTISLEITNAQLLFRGNDKLIKTIPVRIVEYSEGGKENE